MRKESLLYLPILRSVQSTSDEKEAPNTDGTALAVSHTKIRRRKVMREHEMKVLNYHHSIILHYSSSTTAVAAAIAAYMQPYSIVEDTEGTTTTTKKIREKKTNVPSFAFLGK